jgi:hypothetical protein
VELDITSKDLFQRIHEVSGYGEAMKLEQFDKDIEDWVTVDTDTIEPADGAKFRVVHYIDACEN